MIFCVRILIYIYLETKQSHAGIVCAGFDSAFVYLLHMHLMRAIQIDFTSFDTLQHFHQR